MITLFDTHAHFDTFEARQETDTVLQRALAAGVRQLVAVGGTPASNRVVLSVAQQYPAHIWAAVGLERDQAAMPAVPPFDESILEHPRVVAVGEIGLDYHYTPETAAAQRALFESMLELALKYQKPVLVHSREADEDTRCLLAAYSQRWPRTTPPGVLHCFTGSTAFAGKLLDLGFMISFSGILSFKNAGALRETVATIPANRLLIETDCPYLAPVPHRGKENEPAFLREVAVVVAQARNVSLESIAAVTRQNAEDLLGLKEK